MGSTQIPEWMGSYVPAYLRITWPYWDNRGNKNGNPSGRNGSNISGKASTSHNWKDGDEERLIYLRELKHDYSQIAEKMNIDINKVKYKIGHLINEGKLKKIRPQAAQGDVS